MLCRYFVMYSLSGYGQDYTTQRHAVDLMFKAFTATTPGVHVTVSIGDSLVLHKGYGMAHIKKQVPLTHESLLDVGSIAKPITAYGIYLLAKSGALSLNDRIKKYLPDLPAVMDDIEIRHLLHHTSGLRDWAGFLPLSGNSLKSDIDLPLVYDYVKRQECLNFEPGEAFLYTNTGYNLLAMVIESVTHQSFPQWLKTKVFNPLGMEGARCFTGKDPVVQDYIKTKNGYKHIPTNLQAYGSSSVLMTPSDMLHWLRWYQHLKTNDPASYNFMCKKGVLTNGDKIPYGLGVDITDYKHYVTIGHGGAWAGFRAHFLVVPELNMSVALLGNTNSMVALDLCHQLLDLFLPEKTAEKPAGSGLIEESNSKERISSLGQISGVYKRGLGRYVFIKEKEGVPNIAVSGEGFYPMELQDDRSFWIPAYQSSIHFTGGEDGVSAQYKGVNCTKMKATIIMTDALKANLPGTYYSTELDTKCQVSVENNRIIFETANHIKVPLTHAINLVFTGNRYWIEAVEFIMTDGKITGLAVSELRSRRQNFRKM